jgi:opacity protein-like surface antigen
VEPSAGIIISHTKVDPLNFVGAGSPPGPGIPFGDQLSETVQLSDVHSTIGRVGLRAGTTIDAGEVIWQPFATVSIWHEFGANLAATGTTAAGSTEFFPSSGPAVFTTLTSQSSTSTFGTYGQYGLGVAGLVAGTGWLGFARVDFRDGPNLQGLSGTGGIRYQFVPEAHVKGAMPIKVSHKSPPPVVGSIDWSGFYVGGFGSANLGTADWNYIGGGVNPHIGGYGWGADFGYGYQNGRWVFGVEGSVEKTSTNGGVTCAPLIVNTTTFVGQPMFQMTCNASADWLATATARVGYTWDRVLLYVKGGGAFTDGSFSATCNDPSAHFGCTNPADAPTNGFMASADRVGWVIGYGTQFALSRNWSARAETDYVSFGDSSVTASDGSLLKIGMHLWETKIGLNYRFSMPDPLRL